MILIKPTKEYFNQLLKLKQDFINNNESRIQGSGSLDKYDDLNEWLESINEIELGLNPKLVPTTYYLILSGDEVVGTICIRHYLTKDLEEFGGHIGYSIKPSARRKGYATSALRLLLELYKDKYDEILIMCEDNNIASNNTILANSGVLINTYWRKTMDNNAFKRIYGEYKAVEFQEEDINIIKNIHKEMNFQDATLLCELVDLSLKDAILDVEELFIT